MTGFSDLLFLIEEAKKSKIKKHKESLLTKFVKHKENDNFIKSIQNKVNLKYKSMPSKSTILNADISEKNNRVFLYIKVPKISGEVVVSFDSNFNIIDINR